jgi:hypothetical protein
MQRVKLEYGSEITIADTAFEQISTIVQANKVCEGCDKPYSSERPSSPPITFFAPLLH